MVSGLYVYLRTLMTRKHWANFPFHPGKWPFFYGWMILLWSAMGIVMSVPGQTIGVSVFTDPLLGALGISRGDLSLAYMLGTIASSLLLGWAGKFYDRFGARPMALIATIGLGFVLLFLSQVDTFLFQFLEVDSSVIIISVMFLAFLFLRFFGQGMLTMASRNMMVQWFEQRRGFASGFSNVVVSLAFSSSPVLLYFLVEYFTWKGAWIVMAIVAGIIFPIIVIVFYRNKPEDSGLTPDCDYVPSEKKSRNLFPVIKQFSLFEARRNYAFWIFSVMLGMQGLYITAFTFHIISIFDMAGYSEEVAIRIFQPGAIIAVITTLVASSVSDHIQLKYLLYVKGIGACTAIVGVIFLAQWDIAYYMIILGNGIMGGLFSVLVTVIWPRYYGREHLGAISGQAMMIMVFASAFGPILFSTSLTHFGSYGAGAWACLVVYGGLTLAATRANNPQIKLRKVNK